MSTSQFDSIYADLRHLELKSLVPELRKNSFQSSGDLLDYVLQYGVENCENAAVKYVTGWIHKLQPAAFGRAVEIGNSGAIGIILDHISNEDRKSMVEMYRDNIARAVEQEMLSTIYMLISHKCLDCEQFIDQFMGLVAADKVTLINCVIGDQSFGKILVKLFRHAITNGAVKVTKCLLKHKLVSDIVTENTICAVVSASGAECERVVSALLAQFTEIPITKVALEHIEASGTAPMLKDILSHRRFTMQFEYAVALAHRLITARKFEMLDVLLNAASYPIHGYRNSIVIGAALASPIALSIVLKCPKFDVDACVAEILERICDFEPTTAVEIVSMLLADDRVNVGLIDSAQYTNTSIYAVVDRMIRKRSSLAKLV